MISRWNSDYRGKKISSEGIELDNHQVIKELEPEAAYTYQGIDEGDGTDHQGMKVKIRKEYKRRLKLILKSELNARNKMTAINTLAVPIVSYSYGVINWKVEDIHNLDRLTRKQLCMNRMLAKKADMDRIYLPYLQRGSGLMNLEKEYKARMVGLFKYMRTKKYPQIAAILRHQRSKALYSVPAEAIKYMNETQTEEDMYTEDALTATATK